MNITDSITMEYLSSISDAHGLLCSFCGNQSSKLFDEKQIWDLIVDGIEWVGVDQPTVFQIPSDLINQTYEVELDENRCRGQYGYIVEYSVSKDVVTLVFDELPTQYDIEMIQTVREVQSWIMSGDVCQIIECDTCGSEVHWTELNTPAGAGAQPLSFMDKALTLRYGIGRCCREHQTSVTPRANNTKS